MLPEVTVLMSVHNVEKYLRESIESILHQTFTDFEFLIINDRSTDASRDIILSYDDPRIRLIDNKKNVGQATSLNIGLQEAEGKFIARIDQDDISMPDRLRKQVHFMVNNSEVGVLGTKAQFLNEAGEGFSLRYDEKLYETDDMMKAQLLFKSCFLHPSTMIRTDILREYNLSYQEEYKLSEDYLLWFKLSSFCRFANLPQSLIKYRHHKEQLSTDLGYDQFSSSINIRKIILEDFLGREVSQVQLVRHTKISVAQCGSTIAEINQAEKWLQLLVQGNNTIKKYKSESFFQVLENVWMLLCMNSSHLGMKLLLKYLSSTFRRFKIENFYQEMKLIIKCLIKYKVRLLEYDWTFENQEVELSE